MFPVTLATILLWCLFCRTESLGDQEIVFGLKLGWEKFWGTKNSEASQAGETNK